MSKTIANEEDDGDFVLDKIYGAQREQIIELQAETKRLKEALEKYGWHEIDCAYVQGLKGNAVEDCDCGFEQALKNEQTTP